jgi:hypothetical protein
MYYNEDCRYIEMYISDFLFVFLNMLQKYSILCLTGHCQPPDAIRYVFTLLTSTEYEL